MKGKKIISIVVMVTIITAGIFFNYRSDTLASERITLEPTIVDETGVDILSQFKLVTPSQRDIEEIRNGLSISPEAKYEMIKKKDGEYYIKFQEELKRDTVYIFNLELEGYNTSWAYQTQKKFEILGTLPRDKSQRVPVRSGIEIVFTHQGVTDIEKYFEISPEVKGTFEHHKNTVVFVPEELKEETIYTIKVKKGLGLSGSEQVLENDLVFQFETDRKDSVNKEYINFVSFLSEFSSIEKPVLNIAHYENYRNSSKEKVNKNVDISVYKYKNYEDFMNVVQNDDKPYWSLYAKDNYRYDTKNLDLVKSFNIDFQGDNYRKYLVFPEALEEGYYLIHGEKGENTFQTLIQVTNISAFYTESETKTLFWVHNLEEKKPLKDAKIEINGSKYLTDEKGLAIYETEPNQKENVDIGNEIKYIKISKGNMNPLILRLYPHYGFIEKSYYYPTSNEFFNYTFLDRGMYKPGDTVNYWGLVKSIKNEKIDDLSVELSRGYWVSPDQYLLKNEVVLRDDGTFEGYFQLPNLKEGYYNLIFKSGDKIINSTYLQIERYVKPAYKFDITADKKAIFTDENINFDITASFFEGTPVSNLDFDYYIDGTRKFDKTDMNGKFRLTYEPQERSTHASQYYQYMRLNVNSRLPEIGDISASKSFLVYLKDQMITASSDVTDNVGKVTINLNNIDLTDLNNSDNEYVYNNDNSIIGGPVKNKEVTVKLIKNEWEKIEDGTTYDFINKVTVKNYRYETKRITIESKTLITDDKGTVDYQFNIEEDGNYNVEISAKDSQGRPIFRSVYVSDAVPYWQYDSIELKSNKGEYNLGDEVTLDFLKGEETIEHTGDVLFFKSLNGIKEYDFSNKPQYKFNYKEEYIPNIFVKGVVFNGKTYVTATSAIKMNPLEKELKLNIKTDKISYRPGEEVTLDIEVFDKMNNPVEARINLSIVDEAFFSLRDQHVDILNEIYKNMPDGIINTYISHNTKSDDIGIGYRGMDQAKAMPEDGKMSNTSVKDGGEVRSVFKDTALFKSVSTDEGGKGKLTFNLPHNITEWRVTYQGVTKDLRGGSGSINIDATLPFFTDGVLNDTYLEGDKPIIAVNSYGVDIEEGEVVNYEISVPTLGINEFKKIQGKAFVQGYFELPKLTLGEHKMIIRAKSSRGHVDTIEKTFKVVETYHTRVVNDFYELSNDLEIKGSEDGITTLIFSDLNRGKYYYDLAVLKYDYGVRVDQKITSLLAKSLLEEYFDIEDKEEKELNLYQYQQNDGGISILPYSESELELTAKIADLAPDKFDKSLLLEYFNNKYEEKNSNRAVALYGKAALGQPVLNQLNDLSKVNNLSIKDKLYIALAYEKNGHKEGAMNVLDEILRESGEFNEVYIRIDKGVDQDDIVETTSLAAVIASRVNMEEKTKLFEYITSHHTEDILIKLEKIMFLQEELSKLPDTTASFKYMINDEEKEVTLEKGRILRLLITPENLKNISFSGIEGKVAVNALYEVALDTSIDNIDKYASVKREYYTIDGEKTNTFKNTDIVKVVIYPNIEGKAFNGVYEIVDILPAGLKPIENFWGRVPNYEKGVRYPWDIEGQKVKFYTYYQSEYRNEPMVYYARVISKGEYNCEKTIIQNTKTRNTASFSEEDKIIIE